MSDILKQMQREQIELLQQRVEELERELVRRWADINHLDKRLADALDEIERLKVEVNRYARQPIYMHAWGGGKDT